MKKWTMQDDLNQYRTATPCDERGNVLAMVKPPAEAPEAQAVRQLSAKIGPNLARVAAGLKFVRDSVLQPAASAQRTVKP
jgi:hypothetical protein